MTAEERLDELAAAYGLPVPASAQLAAILRDLAVEPVSLTTVRDPREGADVHVADSLVALELDEVRSAGAIADIGSGAGFPGLVLAAALPATTVTLVESVSRKTAWLERQAAERALANVEVVTARAEGWRAGIGTQDVVTARALAPLGALLEYAAPLLREGGHLLAWKARRDAEEERVASAAGAILGMEEVAVRPVSPWPSAGERHLHLWSKVRPTPSRFPRREGMARKRPLEG
ncbi:16S rRNA (guanine(527)-N(7))-methyltransferase RsmG [Conexibacter sp. SYSU D00693]|uniref:16S rRNA (guanine(527)-N(7))-methyltransferase RsmG n=1 Tax=Conexibacter sp. SYSU D00693 TaxID=2812560 RepID=UPI00196B9DA4|nr:16S rRNA (guanine(527)-N(7))-methyltransferase RsmG [Conexibacter sp. SYSU D00693]